MKHYTFLCLTVIALLCTGLWSCEKNNNTPTNIPESEVDFLFGILNSDDTTALISHYTALGYIRDTTVEIQLLTKNDDISSSTVRWNGFSKKITSISSSTLYFDSVASLTSYKEKVLSTISQLEAFQNTHEPDSIIDASGEVLSRNDFDKMIDILKSWCTAEDNSEIGVFLEFYYDDYTMSFFTVFSGFGMVAISFETEDEIIEPPTE